MSTTGKPYQEHLSGSANLVTTYEQRRAGFVALALERNERATPFVDRARALKKEAGKAITPADLLKLPGIRAGLITAAGLSDKAEGHLTEDDKTEAIKNLIEKYLEPAGEGFVEELVYRYLLTRGDTLGGSMRNVGGAMAQRKLTRAIVASLRVAGIEFSWLDGDIWRPMGDDDMAVAEQARGLAWTSGQGPRTLLYNLTVPLVEKNVDLCLMGIAAASVGKKTLGAANSYLVLGELKGGIDPAGADEHWKTASKAIDRIRQGFVRSKAEPGLFFIAAAIEQAMAKEIWDELEAGTLANAANLNDEDQLASICSWLIKF